MADDRTNALLKGSGAPETIRAQLVVIAVSYRSFEGIEQVGELIVHTAIAREIAFLFSELLTRGFPIEKIRPLHEYNWDDEASMADNNTSAFNYRHILGTDRLSNHAFGRAIDLNPRLNPYTGSSGALYPTDATYNPNMPGTLDEGEIVNLWKSHGWQWGGDFSRPDWQHFDKLL